MFMAVPRHVDLMGGGRKTRRFSPLRPVAWLGGLVVDIVLVYTILLALLVFGSTTVPTILGYQTMLVTSGSMAPTIEVGDAVVIRRVRPEEVKPGDVITYRAARSPGMVTHRVLQVRDIQGRAWMQTQGDAVGQPDPNLTPVEAAHGKVVLVLPRMGYVLHLARTMWGSLFLIGLPLAILIAKEVLDLTRSKDWSTEALSGTELTEGSSNEPPTPAHVVRDTATPGPDADSRGADRGESPRRGRAA